ncbi:MAG: ABC transporter permease [Saprospiraceae bacterium]|nr:ABC transporter permease [Saprospiraceae bacterium]MBK7222992.1 ABC transporter permease [Saprospiraceae bacterium]MBK7789273.1 ABC transporter permease [Saprospiraceae bacterium]MBK8852228.1 ABC transporter permease [Saprospiraceae bacterium]MBL0083076.1 ABC transporter permease [Saprospiraceae bacterium]
MGLYLKIFFEAMRQALDSLWNNKLRTFLSLLGITIGIFCIIAVKSAVDSLQQNIVDGFNELGNDVIYLDKMPWNEDPGENYWKYAKRPNPSYEDYTKIKEKSNKAKQTAFVIFTGGRIVKYKNSSVSNAFIMGATNEYAEIQSLELEKGRTLSLAEYNSGSNKVVLGFKVAESLFGNVDPIGREVKLFGQSYQVMGVLKSEGENVFNFINFDDVLWVGYPNITRFVNTNDESTVGRMLCAKALPGVEMQDFKGELTGIIRSNRRLSPREDNNFSINELSMLSQVMESVFGVINIAGFIIGIFALIVGMFSVANIMFVSVKERTSIIGIKKAIGAKRFVILLEFLIESIVLCLIGGLIGLGLVYVILKIISSAIPFEMGISFANMVIGVFSSIIVGIIAGIIPAIRASGLDPVEAIRN